MLELLLVRCGGLFCDFIFCGFIQSSIVKKILRFVMYLTVLPASSRLMALT